MQVVATHTPREVRVGRIFYAVWLVFWLVMGVLWIRKLVNGLFPRALEIFATRAFSFGVSLMEVATDGSPK